jgi:hypothetical protein
MSNLWHIYNKGTIRRRSGGHIVYCENAAPGMSVTALLGRNFAANDRADYYVIGDRIFWPRRLLGREPIYRERWEVSVGHDRLEGDG